MRLKIKEAMGLQMAMGHSIGVFELAQKVFPKKPTASAYQCLRRYMNKDTAVVKIDALIRLSETLGVTTDFLLGLED